MTAAQLIKAVRQSKHLNQDDVAARAGVDVRSVKRLEAGTRVSSNTLRAVCAALDLDAATLSLSPTEACCPAGSPQEDATPVAADPFADSGGAPDAGAGKRCLVRWAIGLPVFLLLNMAVVALGAWSWSGSFDSGFWAVQLLGCGFLDLVLLAPGVMLGVMLLTRAWFKPRPSFGADPELA